MAEFKRDCKSFPGTYVCDIMYSENKEDCSNCLFYEPIKKKILIIQLGAMGDVVRSTSIIPAIKEKYGTDIKITWLTSQECEYFLKSAPGVDEVLTLGNENIKVWHTNSISEVSLRLSQEHFDVLLNLEIAPPATLLANIINAKEKYGYFYDKDGHPSVYNEDAKLYLQIAQSNIFNKNTKLSYQELIFKALNLNYKKQDYAIKLKINEDYLKKFFEKNNLKKDDNIIGINIGSASRFPSKTWDLDKVKELVAKLKPKYKIILLGGPNELKIENRIKNIHPLTNDFNNSLEEFVSVLSACKLLITGDSLHLHLAIALKIPTVALFFTTPPWQIEDYDFLVKIVSPMLEDYYFSDQYHEKLTKSISSEEVLKQCQKLLS